MNCSFRPSLPIQNRKENVQSQTKGTRTSGRSWWKNTEEVQRGSRSCPGHSGGNARPRSRRSGNQRNADAFCGVRHEEREKCQRAMQLRIETTRTEQPIGTDVALNVARCVKHVRPNAMTCAKMQKNKQAAPTLGGGMGTGARESANVLCTTDRQCVDALPLRA